ncbi:MAG TPA: electron transfer flavoprotein subunit alpha/FixB family protein [Candidatus Limnocylindrales bacterium]|nr:electron transfer flavoprotein subunit alpha/FixB family protein [Candidatus Limnocylindrales bacterium]
MAGFWVIAEINPDGSLARASAELATLARELASTAGTEAHGIVVATEPSAAAKELATYLGDVIAIADPSLADHAWAQVAAQRAAEVIDTSGPTAILTGAASDGRDIAGTLLALLDGAILVNATAVTWAEGSGESVEMSVFGGKLITTSSFRDGVDVRIVTVRPNVVTAETASAPGTVRTESPKADLTLPSVAIVDHVAAEGAAAKIDDARIIVAGGRGIGGEAGLELVQQLADRLGGAVGATRAAVDAGWIPYAQQIGQTGKIVKPQLYLALGISGAIQHKVGMQTAGTIIAVNRDPDAPIAEFADMLVVGDLFEVGKALVAELDARG